MDRRGTFSPRVAALCGLLLLASPFLRLEGEDVVLRLGPVHQTVPGACLFHDLTGLDCPFCGLSRGFVCAAHFQFGRAIGYNWASLPALAAALLYACGGLVAYVRRRSAHRPSWGRAALAASKAVLAIVLLAGWLSKFIAG